MEATAAAALAAAQKAEARIATTLAANEAGLAQRRAAFDEKQSAMEIRSLCATPAPLRLLLVLSLRMHRRGLGPWYEGWQVHAEQAWHAGRALACREHACACGACLLAGSMLARVEHACMQRAEDNGSGARCLNRHRERTQRAEEAERRAREAEAEAARRAAYDAALARERERVKSILAKQARRCMRVCPWLPVLEACCCMVDPARQRHPRQAGAPLLPGVCQSCMSSWHAAAAAAGACQP